MGVEVKRYERVRELETYFDELRSYKPLSKREELELAYKMRCGDKTALEKLIKANLKFVVKIAKQYRKYDVNFADLISCTYFSLPLTTQSRKPPVCSLCL